MMKFLLLTHYLENYKSLADLVLENRTQYCEKHQLIHHVHCGPYHNPAWYYAIQRLKLIEDLLFAEGADFVWCLNVGAFIMNMTKKVTDFIDDEHDFFICRDIHGLNAGSFIIKRSDWSKIWLSFLRDTALQTRHYWYENHVIHKYEKDERFRSHIKDLPHPSINSYFYDLYNKPDSTPGHFNKGDLIVHLPGFSLEQKMSIIKSDRVQTNVIY